jgi:signal transduction histidine kinase
MVDRRRPARRHGGSAAIATIGAHYDQYSGSLPWVSARNTAFRTLLNAGREVPISIYEEFLDLNRFATANYRENLKLHFGEKYRDKPVGVIVAFGPLALQYAVDIRAELWPNTAVVFGEIAETAISRSSLPAAVTGTTINITFAELVIAARALVPNLTRIAIVGDLLDNLPAYRHFKEEIPIVAPDLELIDLTGLTMTDLKRQVAALPGQTVIVYTTINLDGAGVSYVPAEALSLVAEVANRPIVISTETFLGRGAVGGFVVTPGAVGQDAARLALRIFNGEDVSTIAATTDSVNKPVFDWHQLQRWGISESALPPGSEIRFREPTVWDQYRVHILTILAALLLQAALICWLIYEHRRRHLAEIQSRNAMSELTLMNRRASAGQLSASIAHEINQPLGIVTRANAALRWLRAETPNLEKVGAALEQIVIAGHRAGDIVTSVRAMFRKDRGNQIVPLDINELILTVLAIVRVDLQRNGVDLQTHLGEKVSLVEGDKVQLQQVVLNLVMNAIDSMQSVHPRALKVKSEQSNPDMVHVSIEDTGTGIDPSNLDKIFSPLFTTKERGMGMGLSICHSIIEIHNGRIWVSPGVTRGSIFQFELPTKSNEDKVGKMAA